MPVVHSDAFMATVAQVLPTLGIALSFEIGAWWRTVLADESGKDFDESKKTLASYAAGMGTNLAIGEIMALSAVLFRYPGWTIWIPLGITIFTTLSALFGMVMVPVTQIQSMSKPRRPARSRRRTR